MPSRDPDLPPSLDALRELAERAYAEIPSHLRRVAEGLAIHVQEFPDEETVEAMELESPFDLLGLYAGVSVDQRSGADVSQDLDRVFLYRRPILDYWCESGEPLSHIVRHVLIHEIGHHFGFSDEDMEAIEEA